uniref:Transmembrane protein n=1 Tax=Tanacetum cinerariifolium TaxID=118510 RepID=A0A699HMC0_TANCI|nr:hypothetical protein [Tanacetum cinerariifolium]
MVSISLKGFLPFILLLVVIIIAVVIVAVILVVVVFDMIVGVVIIVIYALVSGPLVYEIYWWLPPESEFPFFTTRIFLGPVFLLGLSAFAMAAACTSRAVATPFVISCRMVASVIASVADVDVLLRGIYQHIHANTE